MIARRRIKFLQSLQDVHGQHRVLHNLYARIGKRELFWLRTLRDDWSVIFAWYSFTVYVVCSSLSFLFYFIFSLIVYFLSAALRRIKILSSSRHLLSVGYMQTVSSTRCYKHSAATNWNDLPYDIRDCSSVSVFKCKLKSHLFSIA